MNRRPHSRRFEQDKQAFFQDGKRLDEAGDPAAASILFHRNASVMKLLLPASTDMSHELDHYYPYSLYPELHDDPANFRHAHRRCNRERGNGQPTASIGDVIAEWW